VTAAAATARRTAPGRAPRRRARCAALPWRRARACRARARSPGGGVRGLCEGARHHGATLDPSLEASLASLGACLTTVN
jgi:hypothetical protein